MAFDDIQYFVAALGGESAWVEYYKSQHDQQEPPCPYSTCNIDGVGGVTFGEIKQFTALIGTSAALAMQYTWDGENRLVQVDPKGPAVEGNLRLEFVYDHMGRRVQKKVWTWQSGAWALTDGIRELGTVTYFQRELGN